MEYRLLTAGGIPLLAMHRYEPISCRRILVNSRVSPSYLETAAKTIDLITHSLGIKVRLKSDKYIQSTNSFHLQISERKFHYNI